jgi:hypothetical protein
MATEFSQDEVAHALSNMRDCSKLTDEELTERMKDAKLGEGVIAEAGYREFMKVNIRPADTSEKDQA